MHRPNTVSATTAILTPCAVCKTLRRRCADKCVLAPYFPPNEPHKFAIAHRIFGASNIIKLLQEIPEDQRGDAVTSMVYEAKARLRDPIYGCVGTICHLQKQLDELRVELAQAQAEVLNMQCQNANLVDQFCQNMKNKEVHENSSPLDDEMQYHGNPTFFFDEGMMGNSPLWT
ncbi:LOB domain-containing protein 1-like [Salvia hispanica]|uniref:LOB domain-containing protein 1-like n=1 Tax=Salvia hispanica TaxID=49212 RepID=UPI002008F5D1|nr:LOB domain-containing protein 1-like [Salvia hispanica]